MKKKNVEGESLLSAPQSLTHNDMLPTASMRLYALTNPSTNNTSAVLPGDDLFTLYLKKIG